jgi:hypothetical protein
MAALLSEERGRPADRTVLSQDAKWFQATMPVPERQAIAGT